MTFDLSDYVDVPERIRLFAEKHPKGSLRSEVIFWPTSEVPFIAVKAEAFRYESDAAPGIGLAWEPFPGTTPYTKKSELQNAETSAWGRAIVAVLAADTKRGIASQDEVRNRREDVAPTPDSWGGVEAKVSGGSQVHGEGASGSPENVTVGDGNPSSLGSSPAVAPPELWAEAIALDLTKARVLSALRQAGADVSSASEVTTVQLESILSPLRKVAKA